MRVLKLWRRPWCISNTGFLPSSTVLTNYFSLPSRLGLTSEEPAQQTALPEDTENKAAASPPVDAVRTQRGPVTRQRDGPFKKRPLRCRTRRSLYKLREQEPAEAVQEASPEEPESSEPREKKAEVDLCEGGQTSPKPESSPDATRLTSKMEDATAAAAGGGRIPTLPQESKEQKRKGFELAASASFPEKKPRLEDRQSFRNTIESVHPEKPQPTKEEPKVPPIRVGEKLPLQHSRLPWGCFATLPQNVRQVPPAPGSKPAAGSWLAPA